MTVNGHCESKRTGGKFRGVRTLKFPASMLCGLGIGIASLSASGAVINGTSGSNTDATAYSTTGNLDLSLGFVAEYLIVGGGGGGGGSIGGGGGAGEFLEGSVNTIAPQSYTVTVGAGGAGGDYPNAAGTSGASGAASSIFGQTAAGGGGGGTLSVSGAAGGSGGGGGAFGGSGGTSTATGSGAGSGGGAGSIPQVPGGNGPNATAGGGGGAGGVGVDSDYQNEIGGNGGAGRSSSITGTSVDYAGGGGGGINSNPSQVADRSDGPAGSGQAGGGAGGAYGDGSIAAQSGGDAAANSGSGGGGGANPAGSTVTNLGGDGGSGIVVVRYEGAPAATGTNGGNPTAGTGTASGYTVHQFLATGDSTLDFSGTNMNTRLGATLTTGITGTGTLTFSGPGTLTLNAANTYNAGTTVSAGTLAIGASGSIANTTGVAIASGATFDVSAASGFTISSVQTLSGGGTVSGAISIAGNHSPGTSPGLQTFNSNLTYLASSNVDWELIANDAASGSAGTSYDQIGVGGNLDFTGATTLDLIFNASGSAVDWTNPFWNADQTWVMWDDLSSGTVSNFGNLSINTSSWLDGSGTAFSTARPDASFSISQVGQDVSLVYTAVPEPSTFVMLPVAGLTLVGLRRFRQRLKRNHAAAASLVA